MKELEHRQQSIINQIESYLEMTGDKDTIKALKKAKAEAITTRTAIRRLSKLDFGEV